MNKIVKLAKGKLASSVLTLADAKKLNIQVLTPEQTAKCVPGLKHPSLKLTYHDTKGKPRSDIYRLRILGDCREAFGAVREQRYYQPKGSPVAAYFPRTVPWQALLKDQTRQLVITEGELKAACACAQGIPTIGLGGVSSWQSAKRGWDFLPELDKGVSWENRDVIICFDSDAMTKSQVAAATMSLANALITRGALPRIATMPVVQGFEKTGLDDFIFARGVDAFKEVLKEARADELCRSLWEFNARFAYIRKGKFVWDNQERIELSINEFQNAAMSNVHAVQQVGDKIKKVRVADEWNDWPQRREFSELTFEPGKGEVVDGKLNSWSGWGCESTKGGVQPWQKLLAQLFMGSPDLERQWFERWLAYPIQFPGAKLASAACLWSLGQGQGKTLIGTSMGRIYGDGYSLISQRSLESDFNGWACNKQFILVDDVSAHDSRAKADILKKTITQELVLVNRKYVGEYQIKDCSNLYLTSNRADAFFVEDNDRRYFVHEVTGAALPRAFYDEYYRWLDSGGASALRYHLEHLPMGDFHPHAPPPHTAAKRDMISSSKSELDAWVSDLKDAPESKLHLGRHKFSRDLYTPAELLALYDAGGTRKDFTTPVTMAKALRRVGVPQPKQRSVIRLGDDVARLYIVRNPAKWLQASTPAIVKHVACGRVKDGVQS